MTSTEFAPLEDRFPWKCRTSYLHDEVVAWCEEHFGPFDERWYRYGSDIAMGIVAGHPFYDYYRFQLEEDAVLFQLRWGG
jgi:hypothetical protein